MPQAKFKIPKNYKISKDIIDQREGYPGIMDSTGSSGRESILGAPEGLPEIPRYVPKALKSMKRGGKILKTGLYRLHKGERVLPMKLSQLMGPQ